MKARDHPQLYSNRPGVVTNICLFRDAASRLPDGIGTWADISELTKHCQWLKKEKIDTANLNIIASGALDRLHNDSDPCVKFDTEKKLWIYLHQERTFDYFFWKQQAKLHAESSDEVLEPNCMYNNSLDLSKYRSEFPAIITEENEVKWANSIHKEEDTEELRDQLLK